VARRELERDGLGGIARVSQRAVEQLNRIGKAVLVVADAAQQAQRVGAPGTRGLVVEHALQQCAGAGTVAGVDVMLRRADSALACAVLERRERGRLLEQLAGGIPRAARASAGGGVLERGGDRLIGRRRREREVADALLRVLDELGQPGVQLAPPAAGRRRVDRRRIQRMREPHAVTGDPQEPGVLGREQTLGGRRALHQARTRLRERGGRQQRPAGGARNGRDARGDQLPQAVRDGQRSAGRQRRRRAERARDLERIQRVAAGGSRDPAQDRSRVRSPESRLENRPQRAGAEAVQAHAPQALAERAFQPERVGRGHRRAHGRQHADRPPAQPPRRVRQHAQRGRIEPLRVVDGDHQRTVARELLQHRAQRHARRHRIGRAPRGARAAHERDLQRLALRRQQHRENRVRDVPEQIGEP
jgi:hypothetical protein